MKSEFSRPTRALALAAGTLFLAFAVSTSAQVKTETSTTHGTPTKVVKVEHGEVVMVDGNDLLVKMEDGSIRHFPNIPENARITVDGKPLGIHDLKPGMKLQRTITTATTPKIITTVQTVTGKVWHVVPPISVTLTLENGEHQTFRIPKGQKFNIDGKEMDAFGLKKGMKISATKITEEPVTVVEHEQQVTGTMPPPPPAPRADLPLLVVVVVVPRPAPAAEASTAVATPATLPKTGSNLPLVGLLGLLFLGASLGLGLKPVRAKEVR